MKRFTLWNEKIKQNAIDAIKKRKPCKDKPPVVEIKERDATKEQRGYYFKHIVPLFADYIGETNKKAHAILKDELLYEGEMIYKGRRIVITDTTSKKDVEWYSHWIDIVRDYLVIEHGIITDDPRKHI